MLKWTKCSGEGWGPPVGQSVLVQLRNPVEYNYNVVAFLLPDGRWHFHGGSCEVHHGDKLIPIPTPADMEKWEALKKTLAECLDSLELLRDAEYGDDTSDAWDCIEPGRKALAALGGGKERENV